MDWFDRLKRRTTRHPAPTPGPDAAALHEALEAGPVSYTHLTLPTIYSV